LGWHYRISLVPRLIGGGERAWYPLFVQVLIATKFYGSWIPLCNVHVMMTMMLWFIVGYTCVTLRAFNYLRPPSVLDTKRQLSNHSRECLWGMCMKERIFSSGCPLVWASYYTTKFYPLCLMSVTLHILDCRSSPSPPCTRHNLSSKPCTSLHTSTKSL